MSQAGSDESRYTGLEIAVIGMAARFPGARGIDEFWNNLKNGIDTIAFFSDLELAESGISPGLVENPNYVKAKGIIDGAEYFDAAFFDYPPREAEALDPQNRVFHECVWEAVEDAGYDPQGYPGLIGLYAGASPHPYWETVSLVSLEARPSEQFAAVQLYDRDFITSRVSYKLGLKGTTFAIFTACSTSMVAIHLACSGVLSGECDMALAGGVSVLLPEKSGYFYEEGMILSADGHNRTFDEKATGSVMGDGVGIVMLKRFDDALAAGDTIHALIKGSALNNDGNRKLGFSAPSVEGQVEVLRAAQQVAEVEPGSIGYLEAHGTATPLGDAVELEALAQVFKQVKKKCPIGSVKSNFGHLNTAAGVSGFIKTVLALEHKQIPPSLYFETPNQKIDFANGPFYVNTRLQEWETHGEPRRAGVSSFGIGGTNVHVVLEEAPQAVIGENKEERESQLILLSAKTGTALEKMTGNLAAYLSGHPELNLADAAYTLQVGRRAFQHRRMLVASGHDAAGAAGALSGSSAAQPPSPTGSRGIHTAVTVDEERGVVFMFAGLGDQYVNMGLELYRQEPPFREEMDRCFEILEKLVDFDLKDLLYPALQSDKSDSSENSDKSDRSDLSDTSDLSDIKVAQLAVFIVEYSLARLLGAWGIQPRAAIGYSFGEYAAACLAGVISLEDTLALLVTRGKLLARTQPGAMLSVPLPREQLKPLLSPGLSLSIDNGATCIVGGPVEAITAFERQMKEKRLLCIRLQARHALHSALMDPILAPFREAVSRVALNTPGIPYISNVSGDWLTAEGARDPAYWARHLGETVRFSEGLARLLEMEDVIFLEIGPGRALSTQLLQQAGKESGRLAFNLLRHPEEPQADVAYLVNKIGQLWLRGVNIDWSAFHRRERHRISLPAYPFEGQLFRKKPGAASLAASDAVGQDRLRKQPEISHWFYTPSWKPSGLPVSWPEPGQDPGKTPWCVLIFMDDSGLGLELAALLEAGGHRVFTVRTGAAYGKSTDPSEGYTLDPAQPDHYESLLKDVSETHRMPDKIFHLWGVGGDLEAGGRGGASPVPGSAEINRWLDRDFYSLILLAKAIAGRHFFDELQLMVVTDHLQDVGGEEGLCPGKAVVPVVCKVISQEYSNLACRSIDIVLPSPGSKQRKKLLHSLVSELSAGVAGSDLVVAYRGNYRWVQVFEPMALPAPAPGTSRFRKGGVYLITGGLGGVGQVLAKHLAGTYGARLALTGRTPLPPKPRWEDWLSTHPAEDPISKKIGALRELEALGAEVMALAADAADEDQVRSAVAQVEQRFGGLHGVIHTAGLVGRDSVCIIAEFDKRRCQLNFQPKIFGLLVLHKVLQDRQLDFCLSMSSISSVLGGLGLAPYAAANLFMDALTRLLDRESAFPWISVSWDGWQTPQTREEEFSAAAWVDFAMTPEEGVESVERVLALEDPGHLVHSTGDLQARIHQWLDLESLRQKKSSSTRDQQAAAYARPALSNPYIAPQNELEEKIAEVWQQFLGIDQIGIEDNFFDLNATSLDIVRVNGLLVEALKRDIPVVTMFNYPTTGSLSRFLSQGGAAEMDTRQELKRGEVIRQAQNRIQKMRNRTTPTRN